MPVKPLTFKGDKKTKKRKHRTLEDDDRKTQTLVNASSQGGGVESADTYEDESWAVPDLASDISGPTVIVLPTTPPTCLAADAHGNVFASRLENIVEDYAETAEPHDVRQVWVASTVAGTGQINLKGSHGGYLSCDSIGVLGARREARGVEEGFVIEPVEETDASEKMRWRLRTSATKLSEGVKGSRYLCAVVGAGPEREEKDTDTQEGPGEGDNKKKKKTVAISLRGDGEPASESTHLVLKMQARFKPRVQQNKETKAREKISRRELEQVVGRKLDDDEVRRLKRAKKDGSYYEEVLDVRVKGKHDKFAS
ncbi:hypothetical protein A1O3_05575 [Capronia epimyces CBS 606.96]|uniref:Uncharacterized protein n=1 Tax=Capronia epimyces CBS 606.96 TaxID=1182542 RepID=W9Y5L2_9EURO|nr:uncharacterized protein A1O3_05575 [Capronia epimyces CBS 606.96]EXJ84900.1 hypothetical protein A1O3_05575 [Capronia epimyces CBS 606.96]